MKKFFSILSAAAIAVLAGSCQKEAVVASEGGEVSATFSVALPGTFTKAISDGNTVDQLVFGVYSGGAEIDALRQDNVPVSGGRATVTVQLVKGQTYTFAFWAQKSGTGYYDTADLQAVTVSYAGAANDEARDAFYACKADYTVTGPFTETVVLKRPFAQINIGTSDQEAAAAAGIVVEKSEMTVKGVGNTLNLLTGEVSGDVEAACTIEAVPAEVLKVKSGDAEVDAIDYQWLAMNYVLVGKAGKSLVDVTATLTFADGKGTLPLDVPNAPVQGNYRTNIIGALLTAQGTFNIIVDPIYEEPDNVVELPFAADVNGEKYATVAEAVAAVNALGTEAAVLTLAEDWTWETGVAGNGCNVLFGNAGQSVTVEANGHKIIATGEGGIKCDADVAVNDAVVVDNTSYLYENGETAFEFTYLEFQGEGTFKFTGCTMENTVMADAALVEFDDCTFLGKATLASNAANEYALWIAGPAVVKNSVFADLYRGAKIAQKYGTSPDPLYTVEIDGCSFKNIEKKPGVVIDAFTYGGAKVFGTVTIKNSTFENVKAGDQGLYIYETDNLDPVLENNAVVIAEGVNLVDGDYHITAAAGLQWLSAQVADNNTLSGKTVLLAGDIDMAGVDFTPIGNVAAYPSKTFAGTFDGQNHTISNLTASSSEANHATAGLFGSITGTVKNVNLANVNITSTHYAGGVVGYISANTGASVQNCTVNGGTITSTAELTGSEYDNGDKAGGIVGYITADDFVTGCSVSNITVKAYRDLGAIVGCTSGAVKVTGCTVGENVSVVVDNTHNYKGYTANDSYNAGNFVGRDATGNAVTTGCTGAATITLPF